MSHKKYRTETNCLNCGNEVNGKFCSNCGQENLETKENFFHLAFHFISDYFHFDSKFFRSLIPLFTKPGFLTKEYWEGRRAKYIHPLRIFFFTTIIFVIASGAFYKTFGDELKSKMIQPDKEFAIYDSAYLRNLSDSVKVFIASSKDSITIKEVKEAKSREARQIKKFTDSLDATFSNLKYITFLLLPVYALFFRIMYRKQRPFYVDHLVYAMHLMTFIYCLFSITLYLPLIPNVSLDLMRQISVTIILIYIGISVHYLYRQVWWKLIMKTLVLTFVLVFTTMLAIMGTALMDAMFLK